MYSRYIMTMLVFALLTMFQFAPAFERGGGGGGDRSSGGGNRGEDTYVPPDASGNSYREGSSQHDAARGYSRGYQSGQNNAQYQQQPQYIPVPTPYPTQPQNGWQQTQPQ